MTAPNASSEQVWSNSTYPGFRKGLAGCIHHKCKPGFSSRVKLDTYNLPHQDNVDWETLTLEEALASLEEKANLTSVESLIRLLQKCRYRKNLAYGNCALIHMCGNGLEAYGSVGNYLVPMFVECGSVVVAQQVFYRLVSRDEYSWTSLIQGYINCGDYQRGLDLFKSMQEDHVDGSRFTFVALLKACAELKWGERGRELHIEIIKEEHDGDSFVGNSLVNMYAKCGSPLEAQEVFSQLVVRDVVSWNALIAGYSEQRLSNEALSCLDQMLLGNVSPNAVTYACSLKACGNLNAIDRGRKIHTQVAKEGFESDPYVGNTLVDVYAKCGLLVEAREVFEDLPVQNVVSWNALTAGYADHGHGEEALNCLEQMQLANVLWDAVSFVCSLKACSSIGDIGRGLKIHSHIVKEGRERDPFVANMLVDMYARHGLFEEAREAFHKLSVQDVVAWNALISGYTEHELNEEALTCLEDMQLRGVPANVVTLICSLQACGNLGAIERGLEILVWICKVALERDSVLGNALVDMYAKWGSLSEAQEVFKALLTQDIVSWNTMIAGYAEHGWGEKALSCLKQMELKGVTPDAFSYVCSLKACGNIGAIDRGREIHLDIAKKQIKDHMVGSTLVDMYAKCGSLAEAQEIFNQLHARDVVAWTALMAGYTENGSFEEALNCLEQMQVEGVSPNAVTFVCGLKAYGSLGGIDRVREIYADIVKKGLEKDPFVGNMLMDVFVKCGSLWEAEEGFKGLPTRNMVSWNTLLAGYSEHGLSEELLKVYEQMRLEGISPNAITFVWSLKACASMGAVEKGQEIHNELVKVGLEKDSFVGNSLINMYAKCGMLFEARQVFDRLLAQDVVFWNVLIAGYTDHGLAEEALDCLEEIQEAGLSPSAVTCLCSLKACSSVGAIDRGQVLHMEITKRAYETDPFLGNALVDMYAKFGSLAEAQEVFDKLPIQDAGSWTALITGYSEHGFGDEILKCFEHIQHIRLSPDAVTFVCWLKACSSVRALARGREIHAEIAKEELENEASVGNALVSMYAKCGLLAESQHVFDELPVRDVFAWNALISGHAEHGLSQEALECVEQMQLEGLPLNDITYVCSLKACSSLGAIDRGRELHAGICKGGFERDLLLGNTLVDMYAKCCSVVEAQKVLDSLSSRDVVSWNAVIRGYAEQGLCKEASGCLQHMQLEGISPDGVTYVCSLKACASIGAVTEGLEIHTSVCKGGLERDHIVGSALVDMYVKCGSFTEAHKVFDWLLVRDIVSWNTLIAGYAEHGLRGQALNCLKQMETEGMSPNSLSWNAVVLGHVNQGESDKALLLYSQMQEQGLLPDIVTFASVLKVCGSKAAIETGRRIHSQISKVEGVEGTELLMLTALVDMYGKCGSMGDAQQVFDAMPLQDLVRWTALITGYARHGESELALDSFERMMEEGIQPNEITFLNVLAVCTHAGLVDKGQMYFEAMKNNYGVSPSTKHLNCLVDLLGRAGQVEEALVMVEKMPSQANVVTWSILLGACQKWGDIKIGKQAFECMMKLDKTHAASFVALSNIPTNGSIYEQTGLKA